MTKQLPIYQMIVDENQEDSTGVFSISFVESPATEKTFLKFNKDIKKLDFRIQDHERRIVSGVIMAANKMIYRNDDGFEYLTFATKEDIFKAMIKFQRNHKAQNVDTEHNGILLNGITLFENFQIDSSRGILTPTTEAEPLSEGDWYGSYYVEDNSIWEQCKAGIFNGFSISGLFNMAEVAPLKEKSNQEILNELYDLLHDFNCQKLQQDFRA